MLSEAHGRQNKSSNDESYVGSEARFSERAASQYTESARSADECEGVLRRFFSIAVSLSSPQVHGQQHRMGFRWFCPFRGPRERRTDERLGLIRRSTAA